MAHADAPDLLSGLAQPMAEPLRPEVHAIAALALASAHVHAAGYPHRPYPGEAWLARYAETKGLHDARQLHEALHKLPRDHRQAIADDLLRGGA